ncbi:hypothetical protein ACET3Z_010373 [Daucus carota]|nr:PREDICTED: CASP-like protein 4D1 [Daucus carota subsp. sativus]
MASLSNAKTSLVLRILTLLLLLASVILLATCTIPDFNHDFNDRFNVLLTYRYVFSIDILGGLYSLIQIIFGMYYFYTGSRWIQNGCLPNFDLYGDMVINFLLATASGAGFAVTYEINKNVVIDVGFGGRTKYPNQLYVSIGLLFLGSICMAILSVLSSISRESNSSSGKRSSFMTG